MIYVLHGENALESYNRLNQITSQYPLHEVINQEADKIEDLLNNLTTKDLLGGKKLIIARNFIAKNKLKPQQIKEYDDLNILILWEDKEISKNISVSYAKIAKVEVFKLPSTIFYFLDSITGPAAYTIKLLNKIADKESTMLIWHILNRIYLLAIAKLKVDQETANKLNGKVLPAWQWQKIYDQAKKIDEKKLNGLFTATLKIDYLVKTGKTNLPAKSMVSLMLLKYLPI